MRRILFYIIALLLIPVSALATTRALQFDILLTPIIDYRTFAVASGYTAYFYAAGTSTAKNVWTEKEKTNAYTSRTIGSDGTVQVYGDGVYKIIIKDADGTTVYEWDNVKCQANTFTVQDKSDTYTATADDDLILVNTTTGAKTINLATVTGFSHPIAIKLKAGTNNITIDAYSNQTFDASDLTLRLTTSDDNALLYPDVTNETWRRVNRFSGLTSSVTELNQLDDVTVGGNNSGDILVMGGDASLETLKVDTAFSGSAFLDEDNMSSDSATKAASQQSIKAYIDYLLNGFVNRPEFEYSDTDQIVVNPGLYDVAGKMARWQTAITTTAIAGAGSTWYYLYLDYSEIESNQAIQTSDLIWSTTAPSWSGTYHGWYNGSDRCIFAVYTDGAGDMYPFYNDGGSYVNWDSRQIIFSQSAIATNWSDTVTATNGAPSFCTKIMAHFLYEYVDTETTVRWRHPDSSSAAGHQVGYVSAGTVQSSVNDPVSMDSSQQFKVAEIAAAANTLLVFGNGWYLPTGM